MDFYPSSHYEKPDKGKGPVSRTLIIVLLLAVLTTVFLVYRIRNTEFAVAPKMEIRKQKTKKHAFSTRLDRPKPPPVSMTRVKRQGCVADGLLSEYNPDHEEYIGLINRSNCYYLHRAIETWLKPPDFETIEYNIDQIEKKNVVYGMFIAEAIHRRSRVRDEANDHDFDFDKMCMEGTDNVWGSLTCRPDLSKQEYRDYVRYITKRAIDLGVQSFTFGQIYLQEGNQEWGPKMAKEIKGYGKKKGVDVIVGAQTGSITDPKYLGAFDYIEGGVGIDGGGSVESGPCLSSKGSCWALLWHPDFSGKAKNVLLHLDWTGVRYDDLDIFARMDKDKRAEVLKDLYDTFNRKNMGFMMPFFGVLDKNNGGCYGPKKKYYSPDNKYSCQDEIAINRILSE
jgi:hypothetical protein